MSQPEAVRLGDLIDDFCPRCRRLMNHAVASMMESQVVKVICRTCYTEHAYRHGENGKKKTAPRTTLFDQVLANSVPATPEDEEASDEAERQPEKRKRTVSPARYVSRHKAKPAKKR